MRLRHTARRHLEQQHPEKQSEWSQQGFVDQLLAELPTDISWLNTGGNPPQHPDVRQQQLLALRRQHFGTNLLPSENGTDPLLFLFSVTYLSIKLSHLFEYKAQNNRNL